jgi:signal transduction histidine kinase/DNA-binding response OmpR family regulator/ligand-binding sensor domain-containing protein
MIIVSCGQLYGEVNNFYSPQYSNPFTEPWRWQSFPELTGKGCRCMIEDKNGYLWFGINGGVMFYDGMNWKYYSLSKDSSDTPVVSLCFTRDGSLYVGTTKGIFILKNGKWSALPLDVDFGNSSEHLYNIKIPIIQAFDGSIWIGSRQGAIRIKNNQIVLYREDGTHSDPAKFSSLKKLPLFEIYSIGQDKNGEIWFGLIDGRIFKCQFSDDNLDDNPAWYRVDTERGYVRSLYPLIRITRSGAVFIASCQNDGGVNYQNGQTWKQFKSKQSFGIDDLYSDIIELKDGSVCVGGVGYIFIYKDKIWKKYESTNLPFASDRLILFETHNQNLFIIGLGNDVSRIDLSNNRWMTLRGLCLKAEDKDGGRWFISIDRSIVRSDAQMHSWVRYTKADGVIDMPVTIIVTKDGKVWAAGSDHHIAATSCFDGKKWTKQLLPTLGWGIDRRAVFEASDGSLWLGSASDIDTQKGQKGGLVRYTNIKNPEDIHFEYHYVNNNFKLDAVYGIGETADSIIWAGGLGLYKFNLKSRSWSKVLKPSGLNANFVDCMSTSTTGDLWVGTRASGIYFYNSKSKMWKNYTVSNGLSSNTIINILVVSNQNVWVATNKDISHFDGTSWTKNSFHSFLRPKLDGIAIKSTKDGGIWVSQNLPEWYRQGLYNNLDLKESNNDFYTTVLHPAKLTPKTIITFSQEKIEQPGNVILSWTADEPWKLTPIEQIQYSYKLDNNKWSEFMNKTSEIFLSLSSGIHTFEVRARDNDFNIDPNPALVTFYVVHPVWAQPWFIFTILSFLSIIAFFIYHLYHRNKIIEEISETKVRLFANISHELRTPLTLIIGPLLKVIKSPSLSDDLRKPLDIANRNSQRLLRLVNQVLDFRKLESGQFKFEPKKDNIIDFLKDEMLTFTEFAEAKSINLKFDSRLDKLDMWFDHDKIEKIVYNLLYNALKFTLSSGSVCINVTKIEEGRIKSIDLGLQKPIKFSSWLQIIVKDSGIGISSENIGKIFDRFYQVREHIKTAVGGTGIGLSVVKEMVEIHGGEIKVESSEGIGTSFAVKIPIIDEICFDSTLPMEIMDEPEFMKFKYPELNKDDIESVGSGKNTLKNKGKIMIVEDHNEMREYIRGELIDDYEVMEAVNGEDALNKASTFGPEIIISDIMMPKMNGIEFCKAIKSDERTSHIAVILLTARSSYENKMEGLETGADDYIVKPFYGEELKSRIRNILETRKKLREKFGKYLDVEPSKIEITSVDQIFMKKAINIIEEHIDDPDFNVETFSRLVGMSRVSLYNKLKSLTNHSVQEFIFLIRLKRAAQLLKESGMTVTEIAYSVGFKDPSHFSKLFKKQFGVSPKSYNTRENG